METNQVSKSALASAGGFTPQQLERWNQINQRVFLALLIAPLVIVWLASQTDIDLLLADAAFDRQHSNFPWRHAWLTQEFNHVLLKRVLIGVGVLFAGIAAWDIFSPRRWSWLRRFQMRVVALSAIMVPATIALIKQASSSHCPWNIERYGGTEPYIRLLQILPDGVEPGHCLPAGHASSALWLISLAVFLLPHRLRPAAIAFSLLLAFGFTVGWLQQLRGAHFLTHTLWSMWIACAVVFTLVTVLDRGSYSGG